MPGKCGKAESTNIGNGGTAGNQGNHGQKRCTKEGVRCVVPRREEGARVKGAREKVEWSTMRLKFSQLAFAL